MKYFIKNANDKGEHLMRMNSINSQMKLQGVSAGKQNDSTAIEQKIQQLRKQLQQIKENKQLSPEEKEKRINNIQKQIDNLQKQKAEASKGEKQKDVSVSSEKVQDIEKAMKEEQIAKKEPSADLKKSFDTFEHQSELQTPEVYALSHDEEGNPVIKFDDAFKEGVKKSTNADSEDGEKPQIVKTVINTDAVDREIEKLKQSLSETRKQLSSASDPKEKELLENKLSKIEVEIKHKDNDTYRQQHMQITEQKVVSRVGE